MPAPQGNVSAVRHGGRSKRHGLVLARLGSAFSQQYHDGCSLRKALEAHCEAAYGELTVGMLAGIQNTIRYEMTCRACERLLDKNPNLPPSEIRSLRETIGRAAGQRDTLLAKLGVLQQLKPPSDHAFGFLDDDTDEEDDLGDDEDIAGFYARELQRIEAKKAAADEGEPGGPGPSEDEGQAIDRGGEGRTDSEKNSW